MEMAKGMREYGTERVTWVKVEVAGTNYCPADKIKDNMMGRSRKIYIRSSGG
jgi:hypothetical protein